MANHEETTFIWNNEKQILKSGQLLTGRKKLSKTTGITESKVYRILEYFENEQQIKQEKTTKFTIITIKNWKKYQDKGSKVNNKRTTSEQQVNTYNNVNNNVNKYKYKSEHIVDNSWKEAMIKKTKEVIKRDK